MSARCLPALLPLLVLLACGAPRPPSFVVLVVDTLRLDHLHFAAAEAGPTPGFDRLRAESVWFPRAYANSSWTLPSLASLLLSQLPSQHGVASWGARLRSEQVTLPDVLRAAGYRTAMFTANRIIAGDRGFIARFDSGALLEDAAFSGKLDAESAFAAATAVSERGLAWLREVRARDDAPYLAVLHFMEPHAPYLCPASAPASCAAEARALNQRLLVFDWGFDAGERERVAWLYAADVAAMDRALARLLDALAADGVLDEAWLVLLADHGEMLGETGLYLHGRSLAEPLVRVPLLFRAPGRGRFGTVRAPISLVDVAPTLLELARRPAPDAFHGRSFAKALSGGGAPSAPVVLELPQVRPVPDPRRRHVLAVLDGEQKLLVAPDGRIERRRLDEAGEGAPRPADRASLDALLEPTDLRYDPRAYQGRDLEPPTEEMLEALRRLGYIAP